MLRVEMTIARAGYFTENLFNDDPMKEKNIHMLRVDASALLRL